MHLAENTIIGARNNIKHNSILKLWSIKIPYAINSKRIVIHTTT